MGYDLLFWRQSGESIRTPGEVHRLIATGDPVDGLVELPIDAYLARILSSLPEAVRVPNGSSEWIDCVGPGDRWSFQVAWSLVHVCATLRGDWAGETANMLIDIGLEFGCPLYDPQTSERFA